MSKPEHTGRRSLPHLPARERINQSVLLYLTLVTDKRRRLLARPEVAELLIDCWKKADFWLVGRFVILPDHVHLFCAHNSSPPFPLKKWVWFWRAEVTRRWPFPTEKPIWQRDFFDRQLRHGESYHQKWLYVQQNPVTSGLAHSSDDWPYQGELNSLQWHEPA